MTKSFNILTFLFKLFFFTIFNLSILGFGFCYINSKEHSLIGVLNGSCIRKGIQLTNNVNYKNLSKIGNGNYNMILTNGSNQYTVGINQLVDFLEGQLSMPLLTRLDKEISAKLDRVTNNLYKYKQALKLAGNVLTISYGNSVSFTNWDTNVLDDIKKLIQLKDILINNVQNGQVLKYNANAHKWENKEDKDNQTLSLNGNVLHISNGNSVTLPSSGSLQQLSFDTNTGQLSISNGNTVDLSTFWDNTDNQTLSISGHDLTISNGNTVTLPDNDNQTLNLSGTTLSISNGNSVDFSGWDTDASDDVKKLNDLQDININYNTINSGDLLSWNGANWISVDANNYLTNFYNSNGSLTSTRNIDLAGNDLTIDTNKFFISGNSGNIGIGLDSPDSKLTILNSANNVDSFSVKQNLPTSTFVDVIGGTDDDYANSVIETSDGGYLVVGRTASFGAGLGDIYIVKLRADGSLDSSFGNGGTLTIGGSGNDEGQAVIETSDGGYLIAGYSNSAGAGSYDMYLVKLTSSGGLDTSFGNSGTITIGGNRDDYANSVIETSDGGYLVVGRTASAGAGLHDIYIVKLRADGSLDSSFGNGGTLTIGGSQDEWGDSVIETHDGHYLIVGATNSAGAGSVDEYIVKLNLDGSLDTTFGSGGTLTLGGTGLEFASSVLETQNGYLIAGRTTTSSQGSYDLYFTKITFNGTLDTSFANNGTLTIGGGSYDYVSSLIKSKYGGYIAVGFTNSFGAGNNDVYIVKFTDNGALDSNFGSNGTLTIGGAQLDRGYSAIETRKGDILAVGLTNSFGAGGYDMYIIKLSASGKLTSNCTDSELGSGGVIGSGPTSIFNVGTLGSLSTVNSGVTSMSAGGNVAQQCTGDVFEERNIFNIDKVGFVGIMNNLPAHALQVGQAGDGTDAIANAWLTFSDKRFKTNIKDINSVNALQKVIQLQGVTYDWKASKKHSVGFIAQDVQKIIPDIVFKGSDGYLSIDYSKVTPYLVEAVKSLNEKINKLQKNNNQNQQANNNKKNNSSVTKLWDLVDNTIQALKDKVKVTILNAVQIVTKELVTDMLKVGETLLVTDKKIVVTKPAEFSDIKADNISAKSISVDQKGKIDVAENQILVKVKVQGLNENDNVILTPLGSMPVSYSIEVHKDEFIIHLKENHPRITFAYLVIH